MHIHINDTIFLKRIYWGIITSTSFSSGKKTIAKPFCELCIFLISEHETIFFRGPALLCPKLPRLGEPFLIPGLFVNHRKFLCIISWQIFASELLLVDFYRDILPSSNILLWGKFCGSSLSLVFKTELDFITPNISFNKLKLVLTSEYKDSTT